MKILIDISKVQCCLACFIGRVGNRCFCGRKITTEEWNTTNKRPDWCPLQEVIQCKDCSKYNPEKHSCARDVKDMLGYGRKWEPNDFCSEGSKRT